VNEVVIPLSNALPKGDRGGSCVAGPNSHARGERGTDLRADWGEGSK
jgi:hypothetical protein